MAGSARPGRFAALASDPDSDWIWKDPRRARRVARSSRRTQERSLAPPPHLDVADARAGRADRGRGSEVSRAVAAKHHGSEVAAIQLQVSDRTMCVSLELDTVARSNRGSSRHALRSSDTTAHDRASCGLHCERTAARAAGGKRNESSFPPFPQRDDGAVVRSTGSVFRHGKSNSSAGVQR